MIVDPLDAVVSREIASASLRTFMRLPVAQRSSVILMDVLGYSLEEIGAVIDSLPAVKAALHRGRARLRELADEPDDAPRAGCRMPIATRLAAYVDAFQRPRLRRRARHARRRRAARARRQTRLNGKAEVARYFGNYASVRDWHLVPGLVEGRPGDPGPRSQRPDAAPTYFILLDWKADKVAPSAISATRPTSSRARNISSLKWGVSRSNSYFASRPPAASDGQSIEASMVVGRPSIVFGQILHGILAPAEGGIHYLLMLFRYVARMLPGNAAD